MTVPTAPAVSSRHGHGATPWRRMARQLACGTPERCRATDCLRPSSKPSGRRGDRGPSQTIASARFVATWRPGCPLCGIERLFDLASHECHWNQRGNQKVAEVLSNLYYNYAPRRKEID